MSSATYPFTERNGVKMSMMVKDSKAKKKKKKKSKKKRVLVVDDHPLLRLGIAQLIQQEDDFELCGEAESGEAAIDKIVELEPDIAIVDLTLGDIHGIELIKKLNISHPKLPILVLSMHDEALYAERALRAGARGYIMKQEMTNQVVNGLRRILDGMVFLSENMSSRLLNKMIEGKLEAGSSPLDHLSDRELEVFQLMGKGLSTREIAEKLFLSTNTVDTYRRSLKKKLDLDTTAELLRYAIQWDQEQQ